MEVQLRLTRGGTSVILDLFEFDPIVLNKQFSDLEGLETKGSFSQTFRVPRTANNEQLFGNVFAPSYTGFDFAQKIDASLSVNTIPVYEGYCQVKKMLSKGENWHELELIFFATVPTLSSAIGNKLLSELTDLPNLDRELTIANITSPPDGVIFAITDKGQKWSENGEAGTRPITSTTNPVLAQELTPCVNALYLWNQIFADAGFQWSGSELEALLEDYWMPFVNSKEILYRAYPNILFQIKVDPATTTDYSGTEVKKIDSALNMSEVFDNGSNVLGGVFTAPYTGVYGFEINIAIRNLDATANQTNSYLFGLGKPTDLQHFYTVIPNISNGLENITLVGTALSQTYVTFYYFLEAGDEVVLKLRSNNLPANSTIELLSSGATINSVELVELFPIDFDFVSFSRNCPENYTQLDFVRDIINMHRLVVTSDLTNPKLISFVPFQDYVASGMLQDWSNKIHIGTDKDIQLTPTSDTQPKRFKLTYTAGKDVLSKVYTEQALRTYGEYLLDIADNDFATREQTITLKLESTPCNEIPGTTYPIPKFLNNEGNFSKPGPKLLFAPETIEVYVSANDGAQMMDIYLLNHYSQSIPTVGDNDLNFWYETPLQAIDAQPFGNLYNRFYSKYYNELYSDEARILEAYFNLTLNDFNTILFNDIIQIFSVYWRLIKIDGYELGRENLCKVTLSKLVSPVLDCVGKPVSINIDKTVNFEDANGDPIDATEGCCTLYGYEWNAGNSKCYASRTGARGKSVTVPKLGTSQTSNVKGILNTVAGGTIEPTVVGFNNEVQVNNDYVALFGNQNKVNANNGRSLVSGDFIDVRQGGLHIGQGTALGESQSGLFTMYGRDEFPTSGSNIEVFTTNSGRINLANSTVIYCTITAVMRDSGTGMHIYKANVRLSKSSAGVASAGVIDVERETGDFNVVSLTIDTTTNTAEHRLKFVSTGLISYPIRDVKITAQINYTQVK